jgi:hypothetical protein
MLYEQVYQTALSQSKQPTAENPSAQEKLEFDQLLLWLRLARLYAWLRPRAPDYHVGYSILIYDLTDNDIHSALEGPAAELDTKSWRQREESP